MAIAGIPVLNYHAIVDENNDDARNVSVSLQAFREQIGWLREEGYQSITKEELDTIISDGGEITGKPVFITFDDGYYSLYRHAKDILAENGFTATLFLSTSFIGRRYNQSDFEYVRHDRQLTWPEIAELDAAGWSIQAHGHNHIRMTQFDLESVEYEVTVSKKIIEDHVGKNVDAFAFPYGIYNNAIIEQLKSAGYNSAYTVHCGKLTPPVKEFQLPRIEINNSDTLDSYKVKVMTGYVSPFIAIRAKLRDFVFANPAVKDSIERLTHRIGYGNR